MNKVNTTNKLLFFYKCINTLIPFLSKSLDKEKFSIVMDIMLRTFIDQIIESRNDMANDDPKHYLTAYNEISASWHKCFLKLANLRNLTIPIENRNKIYESIIQNEVDKIVAKLEKIFVEN